MTSHRFALTATVLATFGFAGPAAAHRLWMLPSTTVVSGEESWVTFDAAASNDIFYPDHQPLRAEPEAIAPDGTAAKVENFGVGKFRSTFDLHLTKQGTWKLALVNGGVMGSYKQGGEEKRLPRGTTADKIASLIPADATEVKLAETSNRNEVFVTLGAPTNIVLKPTGRGLEFVPVTHPNDLVANEPAIFGFTVDGKPAAGLTVTLVPGGGRYRSAVGEMSLTTDAKGQVTVKWPAPGMYWVNATSTGKSIAIPNADRRLGYTTTLEVLGN
ncbi:MAG: DUF4198 domain-containing protein [Sphingomonadales bacterium]